MKLSKTDYISWRECRKNVWVKWHKPDIYGQFELSDFEKALAVLGNEVEELARGMFPDGYLVERRSSGAQELTLQLVAERKPVIFQAVFATDKFLAATDILKWNEEAGAYDLYEIKMSSTEEEDEDGKKTINRKKELQFEFDLTYQYCVLQLCGVPINKKILVRLNKEYVRHGDLDFDQLFIFEDKSARVNELAPIASDEMERAHQYLSSDVEPTGPCECFFKGRSAHCTTFAYNNPTVPKYSVHDLNRIGSSKKYLKELLDAGILLLDDVPDDERLLPTKPKKGDPPRPQRKRNQVLAHRSQKPIINYETLQAELDSLQFPLYFLDYETSPAPVPPFSGYRPYQHIVFQYSLHVQHDATSTPEPFEELVVDGDPSEKIAQSLSKQIGKTGTVIVWSKRFENSRNRELAYLLPDYVDFFTDVVNRTYDLMDIVDRQHYVHPGFKGSASIKMVAPILAPDVSYINLKVKSGTGAIEAYRMLTHGEVVGDEAENLKKDMLKYCKLDTWAMVRLWQEFRKMVNAS